MHKRSHPHGRDFVSGEVRPLYYGTSTIAPSRSVAPASVTTRTVPVSRRPAPGSAFLTMSAVAVQDVPAPRRASASLLVTDPSAGLRETAAPTVEVRPSRANSYDQIGSAHRTTTRTFVLLGCERLRRVGEMDA
jgi:hypothetical protein